MKTATLRAHVRALAAGFAHVLWPRTCFVCDRSIDAAAPDGCVCVACREVLTTDDSDYCPRCASTVGPYTDLTEGCPRCRGVTFRFDRVVRLGPYDGLLREAVLRLKHENGEPLAEELGGKLAAVRGAAIGLSSIDVVVPVPLHWRKRWRRGYNQSAAVARGVTDTTGLVCRSRWLVRTRDTLSQTVQTPAKRWENMRGAFRVTRGADVRGTRILLVDDVLTTGATASAAAGALQEAGAAQVVVAVLAHR